MREMADRATTSLSQILIHHIPRVKRRRRLEPVSGSAGSVPSAATTRCLDGPSAIGGLHAWPSPERGRE